MILKTILILASIFSIIHFSTASDTPSIAPTEMPSYYVTPLLQITTVAGTGVDGSTGDGGYATSATLNGPKSVHVDRNSGHIFISHERHTLRRINRFTDIISTIAGIANNTGSSGDGGQATSAKLNRPWQLVVDFVRGVVVGDRNSFRIRAVSLISGIISTLAGSGSQGFSGDGGLPTSASFGYIRGVWIDTIGAIYTSDEGHRIRRITADGLMITTIAGTGSATSSGDGKAATSAAVYLPAQLFGSLNKLYLDEFSKIRIIEISTSIITTFAGTGSSGSTNVVGPRTSTKLNLPMGVWGDSLGSIFISEYEGHRVKKTIGDSGLMTIAGIGSASGSPTDVNGDGDIATSATVKYPSMMCVDTNGFLFIADVGNNKIRKLYDYAPTMTPTTASPTNNPSFLLSSAERILTLVGTGVSSSIGDGGLAIQATISNPYCVWGDSEGNLYISDTNGHRVRIVSSVTQIISTVVGTGIEGLGADALAASSAPISFPAQVCGDSNGNIYMALSGEHRVRMFDLELNSIVTIAGNGTDYSSGDGGPATSATLNTVYGVWIDYDRNVFISEYEGCTVRRVDAISRFISVVVGVGTCGFNSDGIAATSACINGPHQLYGNSLGTLFIADSLNHRIRVIPTAGGIVSTYAGAGVNATSVDSGPVTSIAIQNPVGVWGDMNDDVVLTEQKGHKIRKVFAYNQLSVRVAGTGVSSSSAVFANGDNGPSVLASLDTPRHLFVDTSGDVFVADSGNNRIRMLTNYAPTSRPSCQPSCQPSSSPSSPSGHPSAQPSSQPSRQPSGQPSRQPSGQPSRRPSCQPSSQPSGQPSGQPSRQPSGQPSGQPSRQPSDQPSRRPNCQPTVHPSAQPSCRPLRQPSALPSCQPSRQPSAQPSCQPSRQPNAQPSGQPSRQPSAQPSIQPSAQPSGQPSRQPSAQPSGQPSRQPSAQPSGQPSRQPSAQPSGQPSRQPSVQPSSIPTCPPLITSTKLPTSYPSRQATCSPSSQPSVIPSDQPSLMPTSSPSVIPTFQPSSTPTGQPICQPNICPLRQPDTLPTCQPSFQHTELPSVRLSQHPSSYPSVCPSPQPTSVPTEHPSRQPTIQPSSQPYVCPSSRPNGSPTLVPSSQPSHGPSRQPTARPSIQLIVVPSGQPSRQLSGQPSEQPTTVPSSQSIAQPSAQPSRSPSSQPSVQPSWQPNNRPSVQPTARPSSQPSRQPSGQPSGQPSVRPSTIPSSRPTTVPSAQPKPLSVGETRKPSPLPTYRPSRLPTVMPSEVPSCVPTTSPTHSLPLNTDISVRYAGNFTVEFKIVLPFLFTNPVVGELADIMVGASDDCKGYLYKGNNALMSETQIGVQDLLYFLPSLSSDRSGRSVSNAGDVNGDGIDDIIIGIPYASVCYLLFGTHQGFANMTTGFTILGADSSDLTGWSVSTAGDVNNDSYADILIGAPNGGVDQSGVTYVIYGKGSTFVLIDLGNLNPEDGYAIVGVAERDSLGVSVSNAGDMNGDGFGEVVIGALRMSANFAGAVYIVYGQAAQKSVNLILNTVVSPNSIKFTIITSSSYSWFGYSLSCAGDVNGDGFGDIIVGSVPRRMTANTPVSYLIYGAETIAVTSTSTMTSAHGLMIVGAGEIVSGVGDVNRDGFDDVMLTVGWAFHSGRGFVVAFPRDMNNSQSVAPVPVPSIPPSKFPTLAPSIKPSLAPSVKPSHQPTQPTVEPVHTPSRPTELPTMIPTQPTSIPSAKPTAPSLVPSLPPTEMPSETPSEEPSESLSAVPNVSPSIGPTNTHVPMSCNPTTAPTLTFVPSEFPGRGVARLTRRPTSSKPTVLPTNFTYIHVKDQYATVYIRRGNVRRCVYSISCGERNLGYLKI